MLFSKLLFIILYLSNPWNLEQSKDGIHAYTRSVEHSKYLEYKIETTTKGKIEDALRVLTNLDYYYDLYPYVKSYELLSENKASQEFILLLIVKAPFPAKNRIGAYKNQITSMSSDEIILTVTEEDDLVPESSEIKITNSYGHWKLTKLDEETIHISHQFFTDPGGIVPAWIINQFVLKHPVNTVKTLSKLISK